MLAREALILDFIEEGAWHPALNLRTLELTRQNQSGVNRLAKYVTAIVVAHLLVNVAMALRTVNCVLDSIHQLRSS